VRALVGVRSPGARRLTTAPRAQLLRVVDCYSEPLLFVEASAARPWQVLHANDPALRVTGARRGPAPRWPVRLRRSR